MSAPLSKKCCNIETCFARCFLQVCGVEIVEDVPETYTPVVLKWKFGGQGYNNCKSKFSVKYKISFVREQMNCVYRNVFRVHHVEINENRVSVDCYRFFVHVRTIYKA